MTITASELKNNLGKYIDLAQQEDIYVTKNGKQSIKLTRASQRPLSLIDSVFEGIDIDEEELKWDRLKNV